MLKGISPLISPDLLAELARMGHGEEILFADAHFPAHTTHPRVLRADGIRIHDLLAAVEPLFELDGYVAAPVVMMQPVSGDTLDPAVEARYLRALAGVKSVVPPVEKLERFAFYERVKKAYAVVLTGETAKYGNVILKKGVTPV